MARGEWSRRPELGFSSKRHSGPKQQPEFRLDYKPFPKQIEAHKNEARVLCFGGAAGPGKTLWLLMDALKFVMENPGTTAILFRRTFPELEASLIPRSLEYFPNDYCRYNDAKKRWVIDVGGGRKSFILFGHLEREADVYQHRSAEWQYMGIDESTSFTKMMFDFLYTRVRTSKAGVKCRVRLTTNPGNIGHGWHKNFFQIGKVQSGHIWRPPKRGVDKYDPPERSFIPAVIFDNPAIIANDPEYLASLENLPEGERQMMLYGDWGGFTGQYYTEFNRNIHVVQPKPILRNWKLYRSVDFGFNHPFACHWHAMDENGHCHTYREVYESGKRDKEQAQLIKSKSYYEDDGNGARIPELIEYTVGDPEMLKSSKESTSTTQQNYQKEGVSIFPGNNKRVPGWMAIRNWLAIDPATGTPWWTISNACPELIREITDAVYGGNRPDDINPNCSDHAIDNCRYFFMSQPTPGNPLPKANPHDKLDAASKAEWQTVNNMAQDAEETAKGAKAVLEGFNDF